MCGRFAASASVEDLVQTFAIDEVVEGLAPTFNAAPTDPVAAVVERLDKASGASVRKLIAPRWGLVPSWSKDARAGARMINARSETVATKPAFARAFASRRCLIPAVGFYEWETVATPSGRGGKAKLPWFIRPADGGPLVMAGIYEFWRDKGLGADAPWLTTCSIITTQATDALGTLHDRMPMVIRPGDWDAWLDPQATDPAAGAALLSVDAGTALEVYRVGTAVNSVRNNSPELVLPLTP